jgi:hypothetical protein
MNNSPCSRDAPRELVVNEKEWLQCHDPQKMLEFLRGKASERKMRLFAVACCRRIWHLLTDERSRAAVNFAERFAVGDATESERPRYWLEANHASGQARRFVTHPQDAGNLAFSTAAEAAELALCPSQVNADLAVAVHAAASAVAYQEIVRSGQIPPDTWQGCFRDEDQEAEAWASQYLAFKTTSQFVAPLSVEQGIQASMLRDIFGPLPFRPIILDRAWLTPSVKALVQTIEAEHNFSGLPILADNLEEADCTSGDILSHCRGPGEHVRGCWVVNLLLGKS